MASTGNLKSWIRGWLPKDPVLPLPIKGATINRKIIDKKLLFGTITVSLIILVFGAFIYSAFGTPLVWEYKTQVDEPIKETQIEESLQPYIGVATSIGIFNGMVNWIGSPQDDVKQFKNIHLVSYACEVDRTYYAGHLRSVTVELHIAVSRNEITPPNGTIGYRETVIPVLGVDSPQYQFNLTFPINVSGVETWHE